MNIRNLIDKYPTIFNRILDGYVFDYSNDRYLIFINDDEDVIKISGDDKKILVIKRNDNYDILETIEFPDDDEKYIRSHELIMEERENGLISTNVRRFYGKTDYDPEEYYVTDLYQTTKCADKDNKYIVDEFDTHIREQVVDNDIVVYNTTRYNNRDISSIYNGVTGPLRAEKIYYLYNGIYNYLIDEELDMIKAGYLDEKCFDYISINGIRNREEVFMNKGKVKRI